MRITFILPHANLSGGTRVVAVYARILAGRGHRVCVVSAPVPRPTLKDRVRTALRGGGVSWRQRPEPSHLDDVSVEHRVLDRYRPLRDEDVPDADVIVATWWETAEWVAALGPRKGAGVYLIQHDEAVFWPEAAVAERTRIIDTWRLPLHKIAVARWLAELGAGRGVTDRIAVVPNAVDHGMFRADLREKGTPSTVGLMFSRTRFKGCDIAAAALGLARRSVPDLRIIGFGQEVPGADLPLPEGAEISLCPAQGRIPQIYASCDAWLFSSRSEGFGLPILEAMACRTPVIGTPAGPAPELLAAGGGLLVRPDDPGDMARAITEVAAMPGPRWRTLSDAAHATASRFTWEHSADLLETELRAATGAATTGRTA